MTEVRNRKGAESSLCYNKGLIRDYAWSVLMGLILNFVHSRIHLTWHRMEGIIIKAKQAILKQYEEKLPRLTKPASFYRPDVATTISR